MTTPEFDDIVREAVEMMTSGDVESACRLTGEALACYDSALRNNQGQTARLIAMAALHTTLLRRARLDIDAIGCGLIALCTADFYNSDDYSDLMDLMAVTLAAMMSAVSQVPQNQETMAHVAPMLTLSAMLLEHWYNQSLIKHETEREHSHNFALNLIEQMRQLTNGNLSAHIDSNPADPKHTKPMLAEIIGHASALNLIEV